MTLLLSSLFVWPLSCHPSLCCSLAGTSRILAFNYVTPRRGVCVCKSCQRGIHQTCSGMAPLVARRPLPVSPRDRTSKVLAINSPIRFLGPLTDCIYVGVCAAHVCRQSIFNEFEIVWPANNSSVFPAKSFLFYDQGPCANSMRSSYLLLGIYFLVSCEFSYLSFLISFIYEIFLYN